MQRLFLAGLAAAACLAATAAQADPDALWKIVHDRCAVATKPCDAIDPAKGYALLKDNVGATQYLLIPTDKVTGIESPLILAPDAPNYFALAWGFTSKVEAAAHDAVPRDYLSLAINSESGRSQNQLHIHLDCLRTDVHDSLVANKSQIGPSWAPLPVPLAGHSYSALRVSGTELGKTNPFDLVAATTKDMASQTLVVVGASFADGPGFIILNDHVGSSLGDRASGEELQDHDCAVAKTPVTAGK
ncbi:MAG TPA: CDP-diacylglycerol diphosphatase [Aliidongia sp.]|nr:CDP-diacylglycerol diphosphatase [Aliidongia sp.]